MIGLKAELHRHTPATLLKLAGMKLPDTWAYQDIATVGKKSKIVKGTENTWADNFRTTHFESIAGLRDVTPETVSIHDISVNIDGTNIDIPTRKGIVGDTTHSLYAIHSNQYRPIQHRVTLDGLMNALNDTSLSAFGHCEQNKGQFSTFCAIANPDYVVDVSDNPRQPDYYLMGVQTFNSHDGDGRYGGSIFGLRALCLNGCPFPEAFGSFASTHKGHEHEDIIANIATDLGKILSGVIDKFPMFHNKVHVARDIVLTTTDAENILWALKYNVNQIDAIIAHKDNLNPEITGYTMSAYDLYNATTSYVSHRVGGSHMTKGNVSLSSTAYDILTSQSNIERLITEGEAKKVEYYEELRKKEESTERFGTLVLHKAKAERF